MRLFTSHIEKPPMIIAMKFIEYILFYKVNSKEEFLVYGIA